MGWPWSGGTMSHLRANWIVPCTVLLLFSCTAAFVWLQLTTPSDGAYVELDAAAGRADAVVVTPFHERPGGLHRGDLVLAVDQRPMEAWVQTLFTLDLQRPQYQAGQMISYSVLRSGRPITLEIRLASYPMGAALGRNWGPILFTLVSQLVATFVYLR